MAELFLFPSLREGFGMPILEAMASGVPVITSYSSSMPEVSGGGAYLINPEKTKEIAEAMLKIVLDDTVRVSLIEKGYEQSKKFSWEQSAREVLEIYKQVV